MNKFFSYIRFNNVNGFTIPVLDDYVEYQKKETLGWSEPVRDLADIERLGDGKKSLRNSYIDTVKFDGYIDEVNKKADLVVDLSFDSSSPSFKISYFDVGFCDYDSVKNYQFISIFEVVKENDLYAHRILFSNGEKLIIKFLDVELK